MVLDLIKHLLKVLTTCNFKHLNAVNSILLLILQANWLKLSSLKNNCLNTCHHAYGFCLQHVLKNTFCASHLKKFLPSDDTAESQSCFQRKSIKQKKKKIEQASYILKTNFATTDSLKGKFIPLFPKSLSHVLVYACNYLSQAKQSWEEKLSQTIYHIYWFLPLAIYHNQNNVRRKTFLF